MSGNALSAADRREIDRIRSRGGTWHALGEFRRVIGAMIAREAVVRYGRSRLGYLWAFVEPSLFFAMFLVIRSLISDRVPFGESGVFFLMSGILTVRVTLTISRRMMTAITGASALMTFPGINPFDAIVARGAIEVLTMVTVLVVFYALVVVGSDTIALHHAVDFTLALLALVVLSAGVGCFNAVTVILFPPWSIFIGLLGFPLLLTSGVFYVPATLPPEYLAILTWNPILHSAEWFREATYLSYSETLDRLYPVKFGLIAGGLGIVGTRLFHTRILE